MTLPFMTTWPSNMPTHLAGKPTYFVEKIYYCFKDMLICKPIVDYIFSENYKAHVNFTELPPKKHTIRFMTPERAQQWEGKMIDFYINHRTKNSFRFAPRVPVTSVQHIVFRGFTEQRLTILDKLGYYTTDVMWNELYKNDGFDSWDDFFAYFNADRIAKNEAEGKYPYIIHWTDLKY